MAQRFVPMVAHGDFDQRVYDSDSDHMIITARKRV